MDILEYGSSTRQPRSSHVRTVFVQINNVWKDYNCLFFFLLTSYEGQRAGDTLRSNPLESLQVYMLRVISSYVVILQVIEQSWETLV